MSFIKLKNENLTSNKRKKSHFTGKPREKEPAIKNVRPQKNTELPVDPVVMKKYLRGNNEVKLRDVKVRSAKAAIQAKQKKIQEGAKLAARREKFLTEEEGFLAPDDGEVSVQFSQNDIQQSVDAISACKRFDLHLREFGPYRINYIKNGRHLAMGGRRGHIAAFDWITKKLLCELNVMEEVFDVAWLHQETMFATAQKKWVYIYDNQGVELHCLKQLNEVIKMEFLPYHFLLSTYSSRGFLSWLDVSVGKMVAQFRVRSRGTASAIAQNPCNAHICVGEPTGVVTFWSPNCQKSVVTKWCHNQPLSAIAFDPRGQLFATAGMDRALKFWDARNLQGPTQEFHLHSPPRDLAFSHRGILALALGNIVQLHKNGEPYLRHKIPADLITWDPKELQTVHIPSLEATLEAKKNLLHVKKPDIQYTPKKKSGKAAKTAFKRKTIVKEGMRKRYFEQVKQMRENELVLEGGQSVKEKKQSKNVLDRFKVKKQKS